MHAFPNAKLLLPDVLPVQLSDMSDLTLDVEWSYDPGNAHKDTTDNAALEAAGVNANVCIDSFLASNQKDANSTTESDYEVMVWLGRFGNATDPLGYANGSVKTRTISDTTL